MREDIVAILCPDVHGRDFWKKITNKYDGSVPIIFMGDYLDPYSEEGITNKIARENFEELWLFKKKWGDNVITLFGNHDLSYYDYMFRCCRFSYENGEWFNKFLTNNINSFKICHEIKHNDEHFIISHAGIHPTWAKKYLDGKKINEKNVNDLFYIKPESFTDYSKYRGGYDRNGSPVWADIREFITKTSDFDVLDGVKQIVGHTMLTVDMYETNNVYCIDSQKLFVLTKDNKIEPYYKKEKEE